MQVMSNIRTHQRFQRMALIGQVGRRVVDYAAQVAALRDQIHLTGFESTTDDPAATPLFDRIEFADGGVLTWDDILAQEFDLEGTGQDDILQGTSATDRMEGYGGNDMLHGMARAPKPNRCWLLRQSRQSRRAAHAACAPERGSQRSGRQTRIGSSPDRRSQSRSPWQRGQEVAPLIGIGRLA